MKSQSQLSRRGFLKASILTGGTLLLNGMLPVSAAEFSVEKSKEKESRFMPDPLLAGVCDIHLHCAPDSKPRLTDELQFIRDAKKVGYRAVQFKSNDFSNHDRAFLIKEIIPDFDVFGSLVMNRIFGDKVNPYAVEKAIKTTGNLCRTIWMPTQDAAYQNLIYHNKKEGIPVVDERGAVLPEVISVMELCAEADICFATGHSSPEESLAMARKAKEIGLSKFIITHANSGIWKMSYEQIMLGMELGAWVEYSYITNLWGPGTGLPDFERMSDDEFAKFAKINPERSYISTDLGQINMPHPIDGMSRCINALIERGLSRQEIDLLVRKNPKTLLNLK